MRTTLALTVLVLALCHTETDGFTVFQDGLRYIYEYRTRVATGVADEIKQYSGFGFVSQVVVQKDGDQVVFQISDLKLGHVNKKLDNILEEMHVDYERLSDSNTGHVDNLEKPFWVDYENGLVKAVHFTKGEDVAKHNNKKALASLFQLYLEKENLHENHFYSKEEDGIGGICNTTYIFNQGDSEYIVKIGKHRNYDNCKLRPHLLYSSVLGHKCPNCEQDSFSPLKAFSSAQYSVKGDGDKYVITDISAVGGIDFTPFTTNGQSVQSIVNQTLHLIKTEAAAPIAKPDDLEKDSSLYYEFENDRHDYTNVDLKQAHYFNRVYPFTDSTHVSKAETLFRQLEEELKKNNARVSHFVADFVHVFSEFSYDEFEEFFHKHVVGKRGSAQFLLNEILPTVGTNPSILFAFHLIEKKQIHTREANEMIQKIPFYVKEPSQTLIEAAKKFGNQESITKKYPMFVSSRLAYGTLLFRGCVEFTFNPHPHDSKQYISDEKCTEYVQELINKFNSVSENNDLWMSEDEQRSLYLRTIVNTRTKASFKFMLSILNGNYENNLKEIALWGAFYNTKGYYAKEFAEVIIPMFTNPKLDYVLRSYAFEYVLYLYPSPQVFANILLILEKDTSEKLKSYIYSTLNAYSNSTLICLQNHRQHIKHLLRFVETRETDIVKDAVHRLYYVHNSKYNYGRASGFLSIPSNESAFPRQLYFQQGASLFSNYFSLFEVGYTAQGQTFPEGYLPVFGLGPKNLIPIYNSEINDDFIKKTLEKFQKRDDHPYHRKFKPYEVYLKLYTQDVFSTRDIGRGLFTERHPEEMSYENRTWKLDLNNAGYVEFELLIPNELGMPISLKSRVSATSYLHGTISGDESDEGRETEAKFDVHAGLDFIIDSQMAVLSVLYGPLGFQLTTEAGIHLPINGEIKINRGEDNFQVKYTPSTEPYDILFYKTVPKTIGKTDVEVHYSQTPVQRQYSKGHNYFGVGLTFNFTYDYYRNDYGSYRNFFKSFLQTSSSFDNYYYLSEKWFAATRNFLDYSLWNPTAKPFAMNVRISPCSKNPTTEFVFSRNKVKEKKYDQATQKGHIAHLYKAALTGKGATERTWLFELLSLKEWPVNKETKFAMNFQRSPLPEYDAEPYEICYTSITNVTNYEKIYTLQPADVKVQHAGHLVLGKKCIGDVTHIYIKAMAEKSEEQHNYDRNTCPHYKKCLELSKKGYNFNPECWKVILDLGRIDKLTVDIEHENMPDDVNGKFYRLFQYVRHRLYNYMKMDPFHGNNKQNNINIVANISYLHPEILDVKITHPKQTVYYNNIYVPNALPQWDPFTVAEEFKYRLARKVFNYHPPMCYITGKYVHTFDNVVYKAPLSENYHLAFTNKRDVFIYYHSVDGGKFSKALKAYIAGITVEMVPKGDKIEMTVNQKPLLTGGEKVYFHKVDEKVVLVVYRIGEAYVIEPENYGLMIYFDGDNSIILASNLYRESQRGLCGNFNGDKVGEFVGPDGKVYDDASAFIHSYEIEK